MYLSILTFDDYHCSNLGIIKIVYVNDLSRIYFFVDLLFRVIYSEHLHWIDFPSSKLEPHALHDFSFPIFSFFPVAHFANFY